MIPGRNPLIDLYRGLALIFIFWDHVPNNPWGNLTLRNFGFSDAAEVFVFLAGYAAVTAYSKVARQRGFLSAGLATLHRAWVLYVVHIFLLAVLMGIIFVANDHVATRDMIQEMNLSYFVGNPQAALVDELLLRFKPNLMDPLPLYIVLLAALALILPLLMRAPRYAIAGSLLLWALTQWYGWNIPAHDDGRWYFNPLGWQVLFMIGGALALRRDRPVTDPARPLRQQNLFMLLAVFLVISATITLSWRWPAMHDLLIPEWFSQNLYPINKTNLAPIRLAHFLALAYCTAKLVPRGAWLDRWPARQVTLIGRHSLEVFCLGVVLAPLADMANALADDRLSAQLGTGLLGVALMLGLAQWLALNKRLRRPPAPAKPLPSVSGVAR